MKMTLLEGKTICFSGSLSTQTRAEATKVATELGARVTTSVSSKTDILIAGAGAGTKAEQAAAKGVEIWTEDQFNSAVQNYSNGDDDDDGYDNDNDNDNDNGDGDGDNDAPEPPEEPPKKKRKMGHAEKKKKSATPKKSEPKEEEQEESAATISLDGKSICFAGTFMTQTQAYVAEAARNLGAKVMPSVSGKTDILVAGKGGAAKIKQAKSKGVEVWTEEEFNSVIGDGDDDDEETGGAEEKKAPPPKEKPPAKAKAKAKTPAKKTEVTKSPKTDPITPAAAAKATVTATATATAVGSPTRRVMQCAQQYQGSFEVYCDYDVKLMLSDSLNANSNKFYKLQLLQNGDKFHVCTNWGRLGEPGKSQLKGPFDQDKGISEFSKVFKSKTKNTWGTIPFVRYEDKYQLVETTEDGDADDSTALGRLTESQINKGQEVLKELRDVLESSSNKKTKTTIGQLSNDFYSLIPTTSGRQRPPPLDNLDIITEKEGLLEFWLRMGFEPLGDSDVSGSPIEGVKDMPVPKTLLEAASNISDSGSISASRNRGKALAKDGKVKMGPELYAAILLYTGNSIYREMNRCLRVDWKNARKYWRYLRLYFEAMNAMEPKSVTLYRGIAADLYEEYVPGKIITWWTVSSCTASKGVAENFMSQLGGTATFLTLKCKKAVDVSHLSFYPHEEESLLAPGTILKVLKREKSGNLVKIEVEEVEEEEE